MPRKLRSHMDPLVFACVLGIALCGVAAAAILIAPSSGSGSLDIPPAQQADAVLPTTQIPVVSGTTPAEIFGAVPRRVRTVPVGPDGKLIQAE